MQRRHDALLKGGIEIDKHVPATDDVHLRERRIAGKIVFRKNAAVAYLLLDSKPGIGPSEEMLQPFGRNILNRRLAIDAGARSIDRRIADVRAKQLNRQHLLRLPHDLQTKNCE